jgi:phage tail sheath protein FI
MPVQVSYPGVYIQEISSGSRTITGVSTSVALFIGMAEQGLLGTPVRTLSLTEFQRMFGATNSLGELHDQVTQFFLNGGSTAWIIRVAKDAVAASVTLDAEDGTSAVLELTARSAGIIGNSLRALVDYNTPSPESTFNITIQLLGTDTGGNVVVVASETFKNLSMNPTAGNYAIDTITNKSELVTAAAGGGGSAQAGYSLWGLLEATGVSNARLNSAIGSAGSFNISVDGGPFVLVTLSGAVADDSDLESKINLALAPTGSSITVDRMTLDGTNSAYQITSGVGGSVRFAPAATNDVAVTMQMGAAQGGVDVDGYAGLRPAPTGLFASLAVQTYATFAARMALLCGVNTSTIASITLTDINGATGVPVAAWPASGGNFSAGSITTPSLRNVAENLSTLVNALNTTVGSTWTATLTGLRLGMTASFGGDNGDITATLTSSTPDLKTSVLYTNAVANVTRYTLGSSAGSYQTSGPAASDGSRPESDDYAIAYDTASREIDLFNILILPRADQQTDTHRAALWGNASVFAKGRRAILLVDPPEAWDSISDVTSEIANLRIGIATDYAALYWPRIKVSTTSGTKPIDPSGALAGVMARTDSARGVWKAPAGLEANLLGVRGVEYPMSDADNGVINPQAVNAIRVFPNGVVSWGARTMVGFDNSGNDDYKYLPIRRLALYIEESLYRGLKWAVFEPNDDRLWRQMRSSAGAFMNNLFRLGAFAGQKASDAYFVACSSETTTQNDINLGIVNVVVGFAPLKPAEFVVITLQQQAGEVQV